MALSETEALVLRTYNLAEADKIVVCLTHENGVIRGVAKGCRKLKNRFGAALEPFTLLQLSFYQKENQELVSLRQTEILKSHFNLSGDNETLTGLSYMADLVIDFSPPYQPNEILFRMMKACLSAVATDKESLQLVLRYFEVWLLKLEGFLPDLKHCSDCHRVFTEDEPLYLGSESGLRCRACSGGAGTNVSRNVQVQLRAMLKLPPDTFAKESHEVSLRTVREIAELTHQVIGRVLERQPRARPSIR